MSYIFRLHTEGNNTLADWGNSTKYGSYVIEQIKDPNGESAKREITSIPSPFARIDLLKTAFKKVVDAGINGDSIYHKMVSDCFDVGQIFFEFDKHSDKFDIMVWDKTNDLQALLESEHAEHRQLGKTYEIYLKQDGPAYNFDLMQQMFFLKFKEGYDETNIVGATSPATLFFTSANDLSRVSEALRFGNDHPFDDDFRPLHKRNIEFIKYWYLLRKTIPNFASLFREVDAYLEADFRLLTSPQQAEIRNLQGSDLDKYGNITVGTAGHIVQVIDGVALKQMKSEPTKVQDRSGFIIQSEYTVDGLKPLVLPVDTYVHSTIYTAECWDKNIKVPYYDNREIKERTLPDEGSKYPYLTIGDFLEDSIVRMPFELNKNNFFDGNQDKPDGNSYLLPLTNVFFKFFTTDDLRTMTMKDNKKMFEMKLHTSGVVRAILRIPIKDGYIEYQRNYFESIRPDRENNDGEVIDKKFGLGILPLIKFPANIKCHYRIAFFDKGKGDVKLEYHNGQNSVPVITHAVREKKDTEVNICSTESYVVNDGFDRITVNMNGIKGVIVPKFASSAGRAEFTFAVDFGTTNTHIEYATDNNPKPFDIRKEEKQLHRLHINYTDPDIAKAFEDNFIPETIADNDDYLFPMRTAFSEHINIDYTAMPKAMADGNIPFLYEKDITPGYNETKTDLKWSGVANEIVELFIENLFILLRNKVLINNGDLEKTKVIWFYPASMNTGRCDDFEAIWVKKYKEFFGERVENLIRMSESAAPYRYYSKKKGAKNEVVTIDVGGGTTDVYVVVDSDEKLLLSFRFASNAIFGDGYNWDSDNNGFVQRYYDYFLGILESQFGTSAELASVLKRIEEKKNSSDIIAFLFSLGQNKKIDGNAALDFLTELAKNKKLKYVFIVFYGAILYFIAKTMKVRDLPRPLTLAFSGNGAKSLRVLAHKNEALAEFAKLIFDGVYAPDEKLPLDIIFEENPKVATCKGGILIPTKQDPKDIKNIKAVQIGDNLDAYTEEVITYEKITDDVQRDIVQSTMDFAEFLFKLHKDNDEFFVDYLGADENILPKVKEICLDKTELTQSLRQGLAQKAKEVSKDKAVEETLFFYPLIGVLHKLARETGKK